MDIALCLCNVNFWKLNFLVYDASFVLYSVLLRGIMGVTLQLFVFFIWMRVLGFVDLCVS